MNEYGLTIPERLRMLARVWRGELRRWWHRNRWRRARIMRRLAKAKHPTMLTPGQVSSLWVDIVAQRARVNQLSLGVAQITNDPSQVLVSNQFAAGSPPSAAEVAAQRLSLARYQMPERFVGGYTTPPWRLLKAPPRPNEDFLQAIEREKAERMEREIEDALPPNHLGKFF